MNSMEKVNLICELSNSKNNINIKNLCCFNELTKFINKYDVNELKEKLQNLMINITKNDESEKLLILKIYKRLSNIDIDSQNYKIELDNYNKYQKMYANDNETAKLIHNFNIDPIQEPEMRLNLIKQILTPHKLTQELLTYELLHYRPDNKMRILLDKNNLKEVSEKIKIEINRFNPIIISYIEDHSWTINYTDTLNFKVEQNTIIISNTIDTSDEENHILTTHMNMLVNYIKRIFKLLSIKYFIIEDSKYDFSWIFISINYA